MDLTQSAHFIAVGVVGLTVLVTVLVQVWLAERLVSFLWQQVPAFVVLVVAASNVTVVIMYAAFLLRQLLALVR